MKANARFRSLARLQPSETTSNLLHLATSGGRLEVSTVGAGIFRLRVRRAKSAASSASWAVGIAQATGRDAGPAR